MCIYLLLVLAVVFVCCMQMLSLETFIAVKFGRGLYTAPWPWHVLFAWLAAGMLFIVLMLAWQYRLVCGRGVRNPQQNAKVDKKSSRMASLKTKVL